MRDGMGKIALVFGASGEQGRAVLEGLQDSTKVTYSKIYAFTRQQKKNGNSSSGSTSSNGATSAVAVPHVAVASGDDDSYGNNLQYLRDALDATIITGDIANGNDVRDALASTKADDIFLVTTTQLPTEIGQTTGYFAAAEDEFQVIIQFFQVLKECYESDKLPRHVVFSVRDNVQDVTRKVLETTGTLWIPPLDDGSIVPHFSAKGKGGDYAVSFLKDTPELTLTLVTIPFLYSNFLGFFAPVPIDDERKNQWALSACFGDGKIDMMSPWDLSYIVPNIFANPDKYNGKNIRLVGERIAMDTIASIFSDLFGKDVIYNPLTVEELSMVPIPAAPAMAQMCLYCGNPPEELRHDIDATIEVCFPRKPQLFKDWLLTHSGSEVFQRVGLDLDAPDITKVTVFGATSPEGTSVVKGLLADSRKKYRLRVTSRHVDAPKTKALKELDPERVEIVYADFDDLISCQQAVHDMEGVFLVTDFYEEAGRDMDAEEQHAKNVIDACESSPTVRHLVFSTKESADEMNQIMQLGLDKVHDAKGNAATVVQFDAKARAAAYARTKKLSVTYVLMPCYSEMFFDMIEHRDDKFVIAVPHLDSNKHEEKVMCMSVDDLGPAVATIFDSYQVYAGHEVGLVTDFVSVSEVRDMIEEIFLQNEDEDGDGDGGGDASKKARRSTEQQPQQHYEAHHTYMKDLGQMFVYMSQTSAVQNRHSVAKTMKLVPSAKPLRQWIERNVDNLEFREKLGLR